MSATYNSTNDNTPKIAGILYTVIFVIVACTFLLTMFAPNFTFAEDTPLVRDEGYVINSIDIDITVNENNSLDITENYSVFFDEESHGIYRFLPLLHTVNFITNENVEIKNSYRVKYHNIVSNDYYDSYTDNDNLVIMLGSSTAITGIRNYALSYTIDLGSDRVTTQDLFYFNAVGHYWDTTIEEYDIDITFPESINNDIYIYVGEYGMTTHSTTSIGSNTSFGNTTITTSATTISISSTDQLDMGEGVTIYTDLPEGYFNVSILPVSNIILLIVVLLIYIIAFVQFFKKSNMNIITPIVEFDVPKGLNSAEVGFIIDKKVDNKDISSLIIYWANSGYLGVNTLDEDNLELIKKRDADENMKQYEKSIFNKIFKNSDTVSVDELKYELSAEVLDAKQSIRSNNDKYFNNMAYSFRTVISSLAGIMAIIIGYCVLYFNGANLVQLIAVIGAGIGLLVAPIVLGFVKDKEYSIDSKHYKFYLIATILMFIGLLIIYNTTYLVELTDILYLRLLVSGLCAIVMMFAFRLNHRSDEGNRVAGQLIGLRRFIEVTEKNRIAILAKENPEMFYKVLPYAYALGVSDVWINKFKDIALTNPDWYEGNQTFNTIILVSLLTHNINRFQNLITIPKPTTSSGSPFGGSWGGGGGGFGGGGFGGGGGGRW